MGVHGDEVISTVSTTQAAIKSAAGSVHWLTVTNTHATEQAQIELNDSADDSGTDRWAAVFGDVADPFPGPLHFVFSPPIKFKTGIYLDITNGTVKVVVGYT